MSISFQQQHQVTVNTRPKSKNNININNINKENNHHNILEQNFQKGIEMQQSQQVEISNKRGDYNHNIGGVISQNTQNHQQNLISGYKPSQQQVVELNQSIKMLDTSQLRGQNDNSRIMQKQTFTYLPQNDSNNTSHIMHQASASHSFSIRDPIYEGNTPDRSKHHPRSETLDSNGNIIRGRKIDSPQLVVVRELRDQEDNEEGTAGMIDEEGLMMAFNSGSDDNELYHFKRNKERNSSENKKRNMFQVHRQVKTKSKSLENNNTNNTKQKKSKSQQRYYQQQQKVNADVKQLLLLENHQNSNPAKQTKLKKQQTLTMKNTKSTREIRSSMGFNELLNQLDKDISLQQSHQHDFKNRTTHDLLKLELSGIRRQNSSGANLIIQNNNNNNLNNKQQDKSQPKKSSKTKQQIQSKTQKEEQSRSQERKSRKIKQHQQQINIAQIPKSILKKPKQDFIIKDQIFQYAINEITPDKNQNHQGINTTSFLHSEHGRNAVHNQSNYQQNGKTSNKTQNLTVSNNINILFSKIKIGGKTQIQSQQSNKNQRDQSSPDRQIREFKTSQQMNINIDKLVRQNIKKMRSKEDEEKLLKIMSEEQLRKRKEQLDQKNSQVRKMNKEKTYRKVNPQQINLVQYNQNQNLNLQQSQDMMIMSSDKIQRQFSGNNQQKQSQDEKMNQIQQNILQREVFMQKTSQTQKIDFNKIKEVKAKNLRIKNHRKSYGLEFIDIKKEIQEELRTIDLKYKNQNINYHNNEYKIIEEEGDQMIFKDIEQIIAPKRLKVKSQKKIQIQKDENYPIINVPNEQFISERIQPVNKIIVIKKNKIRKFMKQKKKFIIIQKIKEQKDEIIKTIKMQENIIKLNEFCKKKLEKQVLKKRNATIQVNNDEVEDKKELSKISGRKILFDNIDFKKTINPKSIDKLDQTMDQDNDSSRLSTEFYEEYYRLINSIKKEQQASNHKKSNISRMDQSSQNITQKSIKNLLSSPGNNRSQSPKTQLSNTQNNIISPKQNHHKDKSITKKSKSKSNLKNQGGEQQIMNILTNVSNGAGSSQNMLGRQGKTQQKSTESLKQNLRAESAPLLQSNQANSMKKKGAQLRKTSPNKQRQEKEKSLKKFQKQAMNQAKQMQYLNNQVAKIQIFYRMHLYQKGFYHQKQNNERDIYQKQQQNEQQFQSSQKYQSSSEKEYETQVYQGQNQQQQQQFDIPKNEQANNQNLQQRDYTQSDIQKNHEFSNGDEEEYGDENNYNEDTSNIIIINQQSSDQKKVVYMSNINSCSLPQSPKQDDPSVLQSHSINEIQKVFEYRPQSLLDQNRYFSHDLSNNDQVHQSISWKPSLQSNSSDKRIVKDKFKQALKEANQQSKLENVEESKVMGEYGMRMFTGSESLLREFKLNTPKQQSTAKKQELISSQTSLRQVVSSNESQQPSMNIQQESQNINQKSVQVSKTSQPNDINSHSSQSLFERNSFQQFTKQKLQQMMKNNEFMNLIEMREKALEYRQQKEKKFIKKMYKNKQYSPRTYSSKKELLEKWVILEQEDIQKTKKQFQEEWQKTLQMIEDTQKNVDDMRQKMKIQIDNSSKNHNQFNTHSSRNSSSSYATISRAEPRKSILEMEEFQPLSQRSMRLSVGSYKNNDQNKSSHLAEQRRLLDSQAKSQNTINIEDQQKEESKEENLIDYLEQSWIKNRQDQKPSQPQKLSTLSRQGIYIEDQNRRMNLSQLTDKTPERTRQIADIINNKNILQEQQDSSINQFKFQGVDQSQQQQENSDDRPLTRSRSEQDLSDLLKKNKINFNDLDLNLLNDPNINNINNSNNNIYPHHHHNQQHLIQPDLDSYRFVPLNNSKDKNEIKIQENLFEDSSNRYSKGKNYYQDQDLNDMHSNDSLLNESELNNYFQDQKFSIEDFKSLDKRKILNQHSNFEDDDELLGRDDSQVKLPPQEDDTLDKLEEYINNHSASQLFQPNESQIRVKNDLGDSEPSFIDSRRMLDREQDNRLLTPDIPTSTTAFMHHQQALLFQNAKPGENIKISDILKKNLSMNDPNSNNSFLLAQDTSQILFQNAQINQSMVTPQLQPLIQNDYNNLANQITEEVLQSLLQQMVSIPKRQITELQQNIPSDQDQLHLKFQQLQQKEQQLNTLQPSIIQQQQQQDPAHDVFVIDAQMNEKENRRESVEFRQRILIEQDLIRVENYINEVIQALQQAELQYLTTLAHNPSQIQTQESNYHRQFLQVLTTPIKRNEIELLNQLQTSEIGSYEHFETAMDLNHNPILPIDLYLDIERQREESQIRTLYQNGVYDMDLESSVLQESTHIHNKSVFDSLNESLMKFRPYGMQGEPMPWSNKNRRLQTKVDTNSVDTERLFFMVKQDVMRWAQTFAGCSPSPIFLFKRQVDESEQFDDELFQETRERRLAQMLATEVVENEHQWLNYEFEEAQVKIDLSDMILEHLVEEVALFLNFKHGSVIQME